MKSILTTHYKNAAITANGNHPNIINVARALISGVTPDAL